MTPPVSSAAVSTLPQSPAPIKPGVQSSEFWFLAATTLAILALGYLDKMPKELGAIVAGALPVVFAFLRTAAKDEHAGRLHELALALIDAKSEELKAFPLIAVNASGPKPTDTPANESGSVSPGLLVVLAVAAALVIALLPGCASLPPGSYAEAGADYSKDAGPTAHASVHIPLNSPKGFAK